jgi:hypothetical protein
LYIFLYAYAEAGLELIVSAEWGFYSLAGLDGGEFIGDEIVELVIDAGIKGDTNYVAGSSIG